MRMAEAFFESGDLLLEACLEIPDSIARSPGVVLCHPHPQYGGNMENNVIRAVSQSLTVKGIAALRFNFRGVGRSQGEFAGGDGEQEDAQAALSFFSNRNEIISSRIGIMGYSFGGMVAFSVGTRNNIVKAVVGVSPIISAEVIRECDKPKLIVCGAEDQLVPLKIFGEEANMPESNILKVVPGADHFWWGHEKRAADTVARFFLEALV